MFSPRKLGNPFFLENPLDIYLLFLFFVGSQKTRGPRVAKVDANALGLTKVTIEFVAPKLQNSTKPKTLRVNALMVSINPCNPWGLFVIG
jgi:hypothetical protein